MLRQRRVRDPVSLLGLVTVLAVVLVVGPLPAVGLSVLLLLVAAFVPSPLAFVAGQLALLPGLTSTDLVAVGVSQLALVAVLTEPARSQNAYAAVAGTLLAYAVLAALLVIGLRRGPLVAGGLVCLAVAFGTYLARRVTLVRLGLVDGESPGETRDGDGIEAATDRSANQTRSE
ncbi:hypothetical protein C469_13185 [Halorubrum lipolyticum DSM 21995]|uniref:DUF8163 domain-containing protein n=1 Tax=Halorubrum lipolyticum DSM 21995 TaxID=1227482 RepID=M0NLD2_9EURY|nr:hypothetical protein C469_13185 [Halorubrum lipolyticum DSM 21995]